MLIKELFSSDVGLFSFFTIMFLIGMAIFFHWWIKKNMDESEKQQKEKNKKHLD